MESTKATNEGLNYSADTAIPLGRPFREPRSIRSSRSGLRDKAPRFLKRETLEKRDSTFHYQGSGLRKPLPDNQSFQ